MAAIGAKGGKVISERKLTALRQSAKKAGRPQKLSDKDVREIAKRHEEGEQLRSLAEEYKVRPETLSRRLRGKKQPKLTKSSFSEWEDSELADALGLLRAVADAYRSDGDVRAERTASNLIEVLIQELRRRDPDFPTHLYRGYF